MSETTTYAETVAQNLRKQIEAILSPAIDVRAPYAKVMIDKIEGLLLIEPLAKIGIEVERKRCAKIVSDARFGERDQDFRSIIAAIENPR